MPTANGYCNIVNSHNRVGRISSAREFCSDLLTCNSQGAATPTHRCCVSGTIWNCKFCTLPLRHTIIKQYILSAFRHFLFIWKRKRLQKKSKLRATPRDPGNAAPQYIARGFQSVARHIRTQTRWSLNECVLVRLASQAVPSLLLFSFQTLRCGYWKPDYKK